MFVMHVWLFLLKMRNINVKYLLLLLLLFICTPFVLFFLAVSRTTGSTTVVTSPFTTPKMTRPSTDHPVVHVQLENGRFSVKLGRQNPFGRILVDQIIEETINKDTKTPEGSKGFSLKPAALSRYYLTVEYRSTCLKQPRELTDIKPPGFSHHDLKSSRITKNEQAVQSLVDLMETELIHSVVTRVSWSALQQVLWPPLTLQLMF